eukprot:6471131-Prymnesium_polylepis.1
MNPPGHEMRVRHVRRGDAQILPCALCPESPAGGTKAVQSSRPARRAACTMRGAPRIARWRHTPNTPACAGARARARAPSRILGGNPHAATPHEATWKLDLVRAPRADGAPHSAA